MDVVYPLTLPGGTNKPAEDCLVVGGNTCNIWIPSCTVPAIESRFCERLRLVVPVINSGFRPCLGRIHWQARRELTGSARPLFSPAGHGHRDCPGRPSLSLPGLALEFVLCHTCSPPCIQHSCLSLVTTRHETGRATATLGDNSLQPCSEHVSTVIHVPSCLLSRHGGPSGALRYRHASPTPFHHQHPLPSSQPTRIHI